MLIADRIRGLREAKGLSQGDIEKRTGLMRSYISRVENGHTIPSVETLEKWARALDVPLYQLFYDREEPPKPSPLPRSRASEGIAFDTSKKEARFLSQFRRLLGRMNDSDRRLLLHVAQRMARR